MTYEEAMRLEIEELINEKTALRAQLAAATERAEKAEQQIRMIEACVENDDCADLPLVDRVRNTVSGLVMLIAAYERQKTRAELAEAERELLAWSDNAKGKQIIELAEAHDTLAARVAEMEGALAINKDAWKWVADNMAKVECRQTGRWLCSVVFGFWASTGTGPTPLEAVLDVMEQRKGK